mmetsp:Transcript_17844/g.41613  ORF Transcript_17844/g.41613 Transcript_17844/m.41613 type:complete len:471 (+) Transcript_17844:68-1480(+)
MARGHPMKHHHVSMASSNGPHSSTHRRDGQLRRGSTLTSATKPRWAPVRTCGASAEAAIMNAPQSTELGLGLATFLGAPQATVVTACSLAVATCVYLVQLAVDRAALLCSLFRGHVEISKEDEEAVLCNSAALDEDAPSIGEDVAEGMSFGSEACRPLKPMSLPVCEMPADLHKEVPKLLQESVPGVTTMRGQRGEKAVVDMLATCCQRGLFVLGDASSPVNAQIIPAIRYIFFRMKGLPARDSKRVECLTTLAHACQDCQQVQAREILRIYGDLTALSATLERQLLYSLIQEKEAALHRHISRIHPRCDLDHTKVSPQQQRAHLASAYIFLLGEDFGLDGFELAQGDRFLFEVLEELGNEDGGDLLLAKLKDDMSVKDWVAMLLADINNQATGADRLINRDLLCEWAATNLGQGVAHQIFYDEDRKAEFAGQEPSQPLPRNKYQPFLSAKVLVEILVKIGMLEKRVSRR